MLNSLLCNRRLVDYSYCLTLVLMTTLARMFRQGWAERGDHCATVFGGPKVIIGHGDADLSAGRSTRGTLSLELMSFDVAPSAGPVHKAGRCGHRGSGSRRSRCGADHGESIHDGGGAVPVEDAGRSVKA